MLSSAEFFESFDEAGFLKPASWTPSASPATTYAAKVRYRAPSTDAFQGSLRTVDYEIEYVTAQLPGLVEGEQLVIDGVMYRVRMKPEQALDGTVSRAEIARVIA